MSNVKARMALGIGESMRNSPYKEALVFSTETEVPNKYISVRVESTIPQQAINELGSNRAIGLLSINVYDDHGFREKPITPEEAKELRTVLQNIREGKQPVYNQYADALMEPESPSIGKITQFLEPRIEIAAELLQSGERCITLDELEAKYREGDQTLPPAAKK